MSMTLKFFTYFNTSYQSCQPTTASASAPSSDCSHYMPHNVTLTYK